MNWFFHPCRRQRRDVGLLASGALPESERGRVEGHLAACAACRTYYEEIKAVTVPLANLVGNFSQLEPSPAARQRWAMAIQAVAEQDRNAGQRPAVIERRFSPVASLSEWARDVIWPCRRIWTGLAAVWLVILAGNLSLREHPQSSLAAKSSPPAQEMMTAFKDRQKILAELLADHAAPREADRQKPSFIKPRTERGSVECASLDGGQNLA
jgi:hypothetical protein